MNSGIMWLVGIFGVFKRPLTVSLHSPNGRPAVRAVQGDCERVVGDWIVSCLHCLVNDLARVVMIVEVRMKEKMLMTMVSHYLVEE